MNKFLLLFFIETVLCFNVVAQNNQQNKIDSLKRELARIKICNEFFSKYKEIVVNHRYEGDKAIVELNPDALSKDIFIKFCQDYKKEIVDYERNLINYPNVTRNHIIYSIGKQNNKTGINMYYEFVDSKRPSSLSLDSPLQPYSRDVTPSPSIDKIKTEIEIEEYKLQLKRIKNTKKLYQDLANTLQHQIDYNLVETADNAGDLLLKHVPVPQGDVLELTSKAAEAIKAQAVETLKKKAGVENEKPIENEVANIVNSVVDGSEKIIELVPGGDKITNHYLWKLFKSTPEVGKGLGHLAASVNIYFRKSEYNDKIQELNATEQQLINAIEEKNKIIR